MHPDHIEYRGNIHDQKHLSQRRVRFAGNATCSQSAFGPQRRLGKRRTAAFVFRAKFRGSVIGDYVLGSITKFCGIRNGRAASDGTRRALSTRLPIVETEVLPGTSVTAETFLGGDFEEMVVNGTAPMMQHEYAQRLDTWSAWRELSEAAMDGVSS